MRLREGAPERLPLLRLPSERLPSKRLSHPSAQSRGYPAPRPSSRPSAATNTGTFRPAAPALILTALLLSAAFHQSPFPMRQQRSTVPSAESPIARRARVARADTRRLSARVAATSVNATASREPSNSRRECYETSTNA